MKAKIKLSITKKIDADMDNQEEIIKRLEAENSLLKKQAEDESIFRSIFENSLDGIILIGADNTVKEWNRGFEDMLGISKKQAIGKNLWEVFGLVLSDDTYSKEEIEELRSRLNDVILRKQQTNFVRKIVNLDTRQERTIHTLYFPVYHSETYTMCIICRDITVNDNNEKELPVGKERVQVQVNILS